jgi:hypothetical protein
MKYNSRYHIFVFIKTKAMTYVSTQRLVLIVFLSTVTSGLVSILPEGDGGLHVNSSTNDCSHIEGTRQIQYTRRKYNIDDATSTLPCGFTFFSVYNFSGDSWNKMKFVSIDGMKRTQLLLDQYKGHANFLAEISTLGCPSIQIGCVRLKLGNLTHSIDSHEPFTLYISDWLNHTGYQRPEEVGIQTFEALAYGDNNCLGDPLFSDAVLINLVQKSFQKLGQHPFSAYYNGAYHSEKSLKLIVSTVTRATCDYIESAISHEFFQHGSLNFEQGFHCWSPTSTIFSTTTLNEGAVSSNVSDMLINYRLRAKLVYAPYATIYSNVTMPKGYELSSFILKLFRDEYSTIAANNSNIPEVMSSYVKKCVKNAGEYFEYSSLDTYYGGDYVY